MNWWIVGLCIAVAVQSFRAWFWRKLALKA